MLAGTRRKNHINQLVRGASIINRAVNLIKYAKKVKRSQKQLLQEKPPRLTETSLQAVEKREARRAQGGLATREGPGIRKVRKQRKAVKAGAFHCLSGKQPLKFAYLANFESTAFEGTA